MDQRGSGTSTTCRGCLVVTKSLFCVGARRTALLSDLSTCSFVMRVTRFMRAYTWTLPTVCICRSYCSLYIKSFGI